MNRWARWIRSLLALPRWAAVGAIVGASVVDSLGVTWLSLVVADVPESMVAVVVPTLVAGPVAIVLLTLLEELNRARALAQTLANTDALTGALNRRCFMERGHQAVGRAGSSTSSTSVLLMDIDDFKQINDRYGHSTGDAVLQMFAAECVAQLRPQDLLARWGGEEFVALLPATAAADALQLADRLRQAIAEARVAGADGEPMGVTVSIGVACSDEQTVFLDDLLLRADEAMYEAKRSGKNTVRLATHVARAAEQVTGGSGLTRARRRA
jgi:diguanylate cyclase (GGDEF)-like protein